MTCQIPVVPEMIERPAGFVAPNLSPVGLGSGPDRVLVTHDWFLPTGAWGVVPG